MHEFHIRLDLDIFKRISLLAKKYHMSINEMMIELLENGYIEFLRRTKNESKNTNRRRNKAVEE